MDTKLGIWLDCEKACLIFLLDDQVRVEHIASEVESRVRIEGETKEASRLGGMFINPVRKRTERRKHQFKEYFERLLSHMKGVGEIYLFGPAETGKKLGKEIRGNKSLRNIPVHVEKADKMTENQMIARVKKFFGEREAGTGRRKGRA
ncbi:MAG TPA: hypothetical protein ENN63_09235 [Bacteroidetes bacterium]|nr:hypothetical protein [Bacteroidota bacterium]